MEAAGWEAALERATADVRQPGHPDSSGDSPDGLKRVDERRARRLLAARLRHFRLTERVLGRLVTRKPRPTMLALLELGVVEMIESTEDSDIPKIVDFAVRQAKKHLSGPEAKAVNAILRRAPGQLAEAEKAAETENVAAVAVFSSHPDWLVARWVERWGWPRARWLLGWNQTPTPVYVRLTGDAEPVEGLTATEWPGYWLWEGTDWSTLTPLIQEGAAYVQDPFARWPVSLLDVQSGETVLDLCAAPGGKTTALAETLAGRGQLVAWDVPERRHRLEENLRPWTEPGNLAIHLGDALDDPAGQLAQAGLPELYDAVLLDAPCSNTGVLRRRLDARRRLTPASLSGAVARQRELLAVAASLTAPGGRLVYSTCSLETEENEDLIAGFLRTEVGEGFQQEGAHVSLPFTDGHDGGGAFLLRRSG